MSTTKGLLHLIPVGLGPSEASNTHPGGVLKLLNELDYFIVERAKTARSELKRLGYGRPIQTAEIHELPEQLDSKSIDQLLAPLSAGRSGGLMSEAGCPAVADPGALIVRRAHELKLRVIPQIGPSSLLLALMASGLNGQGFAFNGYLPQKPDERKQAIQHLERESAKLARTQLFIETPYRNLAMFASLLESCRDNTRLCVARSLSTASEWIATRRISEWKKNGPPDLDRQPVVFLILAD